MGEILVVTSLKGGVGKTTFSAALSYELAKRSKRVLAVDMDLGTGGLDIALGKEDTVSSTIIDVLTGRFSLADSLDADENGIYFMSAPVFFNESCMKNVSQENFDSLLKALKENFDYVIFDMPAGGGVAFGYFEKCPSCDKAYIVTTASPTSVRAAERCAMRIEGFDEIKLIINSFKFSSPDDNPFGICDMISRISVPIIGVIPYDILTERALMNGKPLTYFDSSLASQAIKNITSRIMGERIKLLNNVVKNSQRLKFY